MKKIFAVLLFAMNALVGNAQEGKWSGMLDLGDVKFPLVFNFTSEGCTVDFPAQRQKNIRAEKSYTTDGKLRVNIPAINLAFEGVVAEDAISGNFIQEGVSFPFILKPGEIEVKQNRPQTPKEPFPYQTEEVTFQSDKYTLHGTLSLPQNCNAKTPVVLLISRMGQYDRDQEKYDHKPFAVIADALARNGIASLRYDTRCWGDTIDFYNTFTAYDMKNDAEAGIKFLRKRFKKVGVIGHQVGGTIGLMLAAEGKTDFVVSLAGVIVGFKETLIWQNCVALISQGYSDEDIKQFMDACESAYDSIAVDKPVKLATVSENLKPGLEWSVGQVSKTYFKSLLGLNVSQSLLKIKCPVLGLHGEKDEEVNGRNNLSMLDKRLDASKHEVMSMPELNHLFQHCTSGIAGNYPIIEETFAPEALQKIIDWIKEGK